MDRWWWYGCAVQREEIDRELRFMQEAGIGGVEIQTLYPLAADDAEAGIYNIPYFSPEFFDVLDYTLKRAEELGLGVDLRLVPPGYRRLISVRLLFNKILRLGNHGSLLYLFL